MGRRLDRETAYSVGRLFAAAAVAAAANRVLRDESNRIQLGLWPRLALGIGAVALGNYVGSRLPGLR
jgi:hypothetical protein